MESSDNIYECIVVGAGPGGIVATKELLENGFDNVLCLEQSGGIGGVFAKGYDNLELTSSATFSMFSDFLNKPGEENHFWSKEEAVSYWKRTSRRSWPKGLFWLPETIALKVILVGLKN